MANPSTRAPDDDTRAGLSRAGQDGSDQDSNYAETDDAGPATRGSDLPRPDEQPRAPARGRSSEDMGKQQ